MKIQNTIKVLRNMMTFYASFADQEKANALLDAVSHMKKDLPTAVTKKNRKIYCTCCGFGWDDKIKDIIQNYCPNCGNRIAYSGEK